jgi:adenosylcobyric acid synthase
MVDGKCFGSYVHGILDNPAVIDFILSPFEDRGDTVDFDAESFKNEQYDLLAQWLRQYIDIPELYKIMGRND